MSTAPPGPSDKVTAFLVTAGFEEALRGELGARAACNGPQWPAALSMRGSSPPGLDPVFARQRVPEAEVVRGASVQQLADGALSVLDAALDGSDSPFVLHVCVPDPGPYRTVAGRAPLVDGAFVEALRARRRRTARRLVSRDEAGALWGQALLVQLVLVGRTVLLASAARPQRLPHGGFDLSPWPAGLAPVPDDRKAPSRAYRKLVESFGWLGARPGPGDTCVDLGGAPGGWAWTALAGGAQVTAVDRSPLAPPALGHPALDMVLGNAFTYEPRAPVDWLLCDVICEPHRTLELASRWMEKGWCRNLVATVKFKGAGGYGVCEEIRSRLAIHGWTFLRLKHMQNHHNEAVILARRA